MNITCENLLPQSYLDVKVSLDKTLLKIGREIFLYLESNDELVGTHVDNDTNITFRQAAYLDGSRRDHLGLIKRIEKYLGTSVHNVKAERLNSIPNADKVLDNLTRFSNVTTNGYRDNLTEFGTRAWHTDSYDKLNAMNLIVYLKDIDYGMGGTQIVHPFQSPTGGQSTGVFTFENNIKSEDITYVEYVGEAGTVVSFNGHIIHRANIPQHKHREVLHFLVYPDSQKYHAEPYL